MPLLLSAVHPAALSYLCLAHVVLGCVVRDPVHDRDRMDPAAEPRVPVLLFVLGAEDG